MKKSNCKAVVMCAALLFLCLSLFLTACQKNGEKSTGSDTTKSEPTETVEKSNEYAELAGVYTTKIYMTETQSVELYLRISEDGTFIFARDTAFTSDEKGAGTIGKTEESENAFFYTVVNGKSVEKGERVSKYEVDKDGSIQFVSPMWFGSTEPKVTGDGDTVTYPRFEKYAPAKTETEESNHTETTDASPSTETTSPVSTDPPETTRPPESTRQPETEPVISLKEGTYTGTLSKFVDAMNSNVKYDVTITFRGGNYDFTVKVTLTGGMDYATEEHYNGTYTVNGDKLSMSGKLSSGTVKGTSVTLTGYFSSFAGSQDTLTVFQ